jgi:type IV secretory pathway TraG/TraD family ATPase VirD4
MSQENKNGSDSPFWRNSSVELLVEIVLGLDGDPNESMTLPRVLEIVNLPRPALLTWLRNHGAHKFSTFLESGSHNAETCLADLGMRLLPLFDRDLCAVLSHAELDLDRLFKKPTVLIIEMSEARIDRLRPIQNLLVQQILDRAIAATEKRADARLPFPVSVVIDEFGSAIGAIPRFPIYLNTLRSRRVSIIAAVQGLSQIRALYGIDAGARDHGVLEQGVLSQCRT